MSRRHQDLQIRVAIVIGVLVLAVSLIRFYESIQTNHRDIKAIATLQAGRHMDQAKVNAIVGQIAASQKAQLANRVSNVAAWCGGINASRDYARVLRKSAGETPYLLPDLNCRMIEAQTASSAKPKTKRIPDVGPTGSTGPTGPVGTTP